jgi:hypothetical protein
MIASQKIYMLTGALLAGTMATLSTGCSSPGFDLLQFPYYMSTFDRIASRIIVEIFFS